MWRRGEGCGEFGGKGGNRKEGDKGAAGTRRAPRKAKAEAGSSRYAEG